MSVLKENEFFIVIDRSRKNELYAQEADLGKKYSSFAEAIKMIDLDAATRIIRFNTETLSGEDVTEDFAAAWIKASEDWGVEWIEDHAPEFVKNSGAFDDYLDEDHTPIDPVREWGTYHVVNGHVA